MLFLIFKHLRVKLTWLEKLVYFIVRRIKHRIIWSKSKYFIILTKIMAKNKEPNKMITNTSKNSVRILQNRWLFLFSYLKNSKIVLESSNWSKQWWFIVLSMTFVWIIILLLQKDNKSLILEVINHHMGKEYQLLILHTHKEKGLLGILNVRENAF